MRHLIPASTHPPEGYDEWPEPEEPEEYRPQLCELCRERVMTDCRMHAGKPVLCCEECEAKVRI